MEKEENVNLSEGNTSETDAAGQTETVETKIETSPGTEPATDASTIDALPLYTSDLIETDNFTLQIDHQMTAGDMLVAMLLAANILVMLLCRLLRDRK